LTSPSDIILVHADQTATAGKEIDVVWSIDQRWKGCETNKRSFLVDADNKSRQIYMEEQKLQGRGTIIDEDKATIPDDTSPGFYTYETVVSYKCNMLHNLTGPTNRKFPSFYVHVIENSQDSRYTSKEFIEAPTTKK
jgi:hypothetical protein